MGSTDRADDAIPVDDDVRIILDSDLPNPLGSNFLLSAGEKIRLVEDAFLVIGEKIGDRGQLILSTERVIFRVGVRATDKLLTSIVGVSSECNLLFKSHYYEVLKISYGPSSKDLIILQNRTLNHSTGIVVRAIQELRRQAEYREELRSGKVLIVFDFSTIRDYLDKGGLVVSTVKCPQCGGAVDLPKEGSLVKCEYCGSTVYAQDIFQRLKELVGG